MLVATLQVSTGRIDADTTNGGVHTIQNYGQVPLRFEPNFGQTDPQVRYVSRGSGYTMYFAPTETVLALDVTTNSSHNQPGQATHSPGIQFGLVHLKLEGANTNAVISAEQTLPEKVNYFIGNDPSQWHTSISAFGRIRYQNIYPGVDLVYYGNQTELEHDFIVAPYADVKAIKLKLEGADHLKIEQSGDLAFSVQGRVIHLRQPVVYQLIGGNRHDIVGRYRLKGTHVNFEIGAYDTRQPLVIDPVLSYSSFLGAGDWAFGVAVDSAGNAYMCGLTGSLLGLLTTPGAFQTTYGGNSLGGPGDAFVAKLGSTGIYVTGLTLSKNFPTTNAISSTLLGGQDAFAFKLGPGGTNRLYSTYLGGNGSAKSTDNNILPIPDGLPGSGSDAGNGIDADAFGNAFVVGVTYSTNFPTTNALQTVLNINGSATISDAFVTQISPSGKLVYSTYLGGTNTDVAYGVKVQADGMAVVAGQSGSIDIAPYVNYGSINSGKLDAFVAKLSSDGSALANFAYLGGSNQDIAYAVALDGNDNAYVVGATWSPTFPITSTNVVQPTYSHGPTNNAFIVKLYFEPNQLGTRVYTTWQDSNAWSVIGPPALLTASNTWSGAGQIPSLSSNGVTSLANTRFQRGASYDPTYTSFIIPLNQQTGFRLDDLGNNSENFGGSWPWFTRLQNDVRSHLSLVSSTNVSGLSTNYYNYITNFNNPIAAFGATAGGSPLYFNQQYKFGMYCGFQYETNEPTGGQHGSNPTNTFVSPLRILVYNLSSFVAGQTNAIAPIATNYITIPRRTISGDQSAWLQFATNGFSLTTNANGLQTTVQLVTESGGAWGVVPRFTNAQSGTWLITHEATSNLGHGYVVEGVGVVPLSTNLYPMVTNSAGVPGWDRLYSLDFQTRPPWQSVFIDQPQFNGTPLPSFYQGASLAELTNLNAVMTNTIPLTASVYTNLDNSPELRRHPMLDQLVANLNNDPIALANYVVNQIELTDALAYNENNGQASAATVNEGGVNRSALGVYLEGQGSPVEQCALLVYLLRQAGYPAAFVFPTNNNVQMLDNRLSMLLRMQLHGAVNQYGQTYTTNTLITVNYPWVVTTISNQTVHIFPWVKDTQLTEGLNLYDYMPANYDNGFKWLQNYLYGDTNILGLSVESDAPSVLFPRFVKQQLLANAPGISLDDIGVKAVNRQHYYSRWQDFPTPSVVNNPTQVVCADSLISITNALPSMTNIFNTVALTVRSQNSTNTQMTIGPLRMADLHNREMFIATNGAGNLMLWLAPYILGNTNQSAFDASDPALTNKQIATLTLTTNDVSFTIHLTHYRHQAINFSPSNQFLNVSETLQFTTPDRPFNLPDITAICFNVGRVTPAMIDIHAQAYQQMTYQWSLYTNTIPAIENYQGAAAYMMGMDYYSHVCQFLPVDEQLHKVQVVSWFAEGLSKLTPVQLGAQHFMRPSMDMYYSQIVHAGNGTSHPDSGNDSLAGADDFMAIMDGEIAAQEHGIINGYYQSANAVSSVILLRLAQLRMTNGISGIIELNKNNYQSVGGTNAAGYGQTNLKDYDPDIWSALTNAFRGWDADYVRAYITPGPVSMTAANYRGMGLVIVGKSQSASIISVNMNGVLGANSSYFADTPASLSTAYSVNSPFESFSSSSSLDASSSYDLFYNGSGGGGGNLYYDNGSSGFQSFDYSWYPSYLGSPYGRWNYRMPGTLYQITATFTPPSQVNLSQQINAMYYFPQSTPVTTSLIHALDSGNTGLSTWKNIGNYVYDPVNVMSGEFYHDTVDITVAGPQPLQLRRNYSSLDQSDRNGFGYGWNINLVPYIGIATNVVASSTNAVLSAVELDGSVIAYRQQTNNLNLYLPTLTDNPQLDNFGNGRIGSVYNPFNAKIIHSLNGPNELYTLTAANGEIRTYIVNSFPVPTSTNVVSRQRPYLASWQDTQGNTWSFSYGTNSTSPNYGSLIRIQCSNGNYLGLDYDAGGYVIDAYTSDNERTSYEYDDFGDLIRAVRPDDSQEIYEYQHTQFTNSGTVYVDSTHLLIKEFKPDGRILKNIYNTNRQVIVQMATVGADLNLYTNAIFTYSNNVVMPLTNSITGYTLVKDVNGNTNRYDYANSLVTTNTDALGQKIIQTWYTNNATAPGYSRSLYQTRDKRGLWTQFQYDSRGNVTNTFSWGDLTGDGTTQYATNTASYNGNNLPTQITDPVGNTVQAVYHPQYPYLPQFIIFSAGGTPVFSNQFAYYNATNVVPNGNLSLTNVALGLLQQQIRAVNSSDVATNQWNYDGRGYLTQQIQFTGTGDPAVTNNFTCNNSGEIVERVDGAGQRTDFGYDTMRRPISHEVFGANQTQPMFWEYAYYNGNGEIVWYDGPRYNPEDYQWRDYDGAGRLTTQLRWRSEAKADGSGLKAPAGFNLYAQSFNQYDKFGNLTLAVDPRGAMTTNKWDALGQLVQQQHLDTNGTTVLSTEGFGYEPGGQVCYYTNGLSGVTTIAYATNGLPKFRSNPDGSTNAWRYYLDGRIKRQIQSNGAYWQTTYDDVNRITTRIFYSAAGVPEATNSIQLDRRGNVVQQVDAGGNVFTATYDDLDRLKTATGPPSQGNTTQQTIANFYDAAGQVLTNVNALGEKTVAFFDALRRVTQSEIFSASGSLVRQTSLIFSPDFTGVTATSGSGASAISTTAYTDNDGHNVLSIAYPSTGVNEFMLRQYDLTGNLTSEQHDSSASGTVTTWTTASFAYDGLNRPISKTDRDNASTTYFYDPMGDLTNRTMPGGLKWLATYNTAGRMLKEWNTGGTFGTRTNTYAYFAGGNPFAGLLQTKTDGRATTCTYSYDDRLRPTNMACNGSLPEQQLTTTWQYEPRGFITGITEQFASTNTGPATTVLRAFDPYGQLASESVSAGSFSYGTSQNWDGAGRRSTLGIGNLANYGFGWQADGNLTSASDSAGSGVYSYDTAGLLTSRTVGNRSTSITSRDGEGRPLSIGTTVNAASQLNESLTWLGDGLLATHTLARADFNDLRSYAYASSSRRLMQEQLNLNASTAWTNTMVYDNGAVGGLGVLTQMGQAGGASNLWSGVADNLSRIGSETNNTFAYAAYGHINGQSAVNAWLDNQPVSVTGVGTNTMQWRATMELSPGAHQLKAAALHPSGFYTAWATNSFTNNIAYQKTTNMFDGAGNITLRIWKNPNGTTNRTQTLSWDARGRLHQVIERDATNSGYNWTALYDALNRRLSTTTVLVTNGVVYPASSQIINSYFDPQVEFLELGVSYGAKTEWKLYGPDLNGRYGGLNGTGGFDAVSPGLNQFDPTVSDARGNILGYFDQLLGSVTWNPSRPTGYGAVPGYRPVALANGANVAQSSAWRSREVDITGYHQIGLRPYDSAAGRWLSYDSVWNEGDPNYLSFAGDDPVNDFDPDGRCFESNQNTPPPLELGIAPEMIQKLETQIFYKNGTSSERFALDDQAILSDPNQISGQSYWNVTTRTGRSIEYVRYQNSGGPLSDPDYGYYKSVPVNKFQVEQQKNLEGLKIIATGLLYADGAGAILDTAGFRLMAAEETAGLRQLGGVRNTQPLTPAQIEQVYQHVDELGLSRSDFLIHSGPSLYSDMMDKVLVGPDVFPGLASDGSVLSQLSPRAVIAHEAGHMINTVGGMAFEAGSVADEAAASTMGSQLPGLTTAERNLLLQHAQGMGH